MPHQESPPPQEVTDTFYGIGVIDSEDNYIAFTHDRRRALAALNAFHRIYCREPLADTYDIDPGRDLTACWLRPDHRDDGPWWIPTEADHPQARPALRLEL
ncbi:hypothetical protein V1L54_28405 [Streptomyces sp. TRM 70361]|uniref:hypothetical protein n=1 Tax=Streptomyces sp. TRM 70361 TaxID=3116553 RepID=UPI002E7BAE48|nr:hypothetical protein [Streptomyces sp. TRM 70361]MEE1943281.1 hypothetical protein [Streptomyces sp. TRM 70361]